MATRLYGKSAGESNTYVTEGVGSATAADTVELTVDLATTEVNKNGTVTRTVSREEVLAILDDFRNHILKGDWPPA
jgi:hypothetical protein